MSKIQELISGIKDLSVVEVLELVQTLEKEFGVSAAASLASTGAPADAAKSAESQTNFTIELITVPKEKKTSVIKALRVIKKGLGLMEAKEATENTPYLILSDANKEDVDNAKKVLEEVGAEVKIS